MTLGELIAEMIHARVLSVGPNTTELNEWLDQQNIDPETPIPTWNPQAEAWEI